MSILVDGFIAVYLTVAIAGHLRRADPLRRILRPLDLVIDGLGLRQHWAMFAPNPSAVSIRLHVLMRLTSGDVIRWEPRRDVQSRIAAWLDFRRKLFELMQATVGGAEARRSLAEYLVRTYGGAHDPVVTLTFVRTERPVPVPWEVADRLPAERVIDVIDSDRTP